MYSRTGYRFKDRKYQKQKKTMSVRIKCFGFKKILVESFNLS